jgi:hypothetical protein
MHGTNMRISIEHSSSVNLQSKLPRVYGAPNPPSQHDACHIGTRVQILEDIENWVYQQPDSRLFWLSGHAGVGKTAVATSITRKLREERLLGASFFCTRTDSARQEGRNILPELAAQLAEHSSAYRTALTAALNYTPSAPSDTITEQFRHLFYRPLQNICLPVVVVIDGLDECRDDAEEFELMKALLGAQALLPLKFIVCSRPEDDIRRAVAQSPYALERLSLSHIAKTIFDADIRLYLETSLKGHLPHDWPEKEQWPPSRELEVLVKKADGLFAYASSVFRYLCSKQTDPWERMKRVVSADTIPGKIVAPLDQLYTFIMQEAFEDFDLEQGEEQQLLKCLRCLVVITSPKSLATISRLSGIPPRLLRMSLSCLHSVLYVPDEDTGNEIVPYHIAFFEYLADRTRTESSWFIDRKQGHDEMVRSCLAILQSADNSDDEPNDYAIARWSDHFEMSSRPIGLLRGLLDVFRSNFVWWVEMSPGYVSILYGELLTILKSQVPMLIWDSFFVSLKIFF